jgi:hypothetical protein
MGLIGRKFPALNRYGFLLIVAFFLYYYPVTLADQVFAQGMVPDEKTFIQEFLKKNADKNSLTICDTPWDLTIYNRGAISFKTANDQRRRILREYSEHVYTHIFVVQHIPSNTGRFFPELKSFGALEVLVQIKTRPDDVLLISRVKAPKDPGR